MNLTDNEYPDTDFPWTFFFNGEIMPKWAACWGMAGVENFIHPEKNIGADVSQRDIYIVLCTIDHIGIESADPDLFIYAVQEVLCLLLQHQDHALASIAAHPCGTNSADEIFEGLVEGAFRMRESTLNQGRAFWTSGYEADNEKLKDAMRRAALPVESPDFALPPHLDRARKAAHHLRELQIVRLRRLAQSGRFNKAMRRRLNELGVD